MDELQDVRARIKASKDSYETWAKRAGLKYWTFQKFMAGKNEPRASTFLAIKRAIEDSERTSLDG